MSFDPSLPKDGINVTPTHPLREGLLLVVGVAAVAAGLAAMLAVATDLLVPRVPPRLEARLFSGWFDGAAEAGTGGAREQQLTVLLDRMSAHWLENPYQFSVVVWEESEPNAIALPGGTIAITEGLLERVESENELAFVLGHELGHYHNRDHLRGLGRGVAFSLVLVAVGLSGSGSATQLAAIAGQFTQRGFNRVQESDADRFGLELLAAEYGHTAGATDFFDHLPSDDGLSGYLSTHPLHDQRIHTLRAAARAAGWPLRGKRRALGWPSDSVGAEVREQVPGRGE